MKKSTQKTTQKSSAGLGLTLAHNVCAEIIYAHGKGLMTSKQDKRHAQQADMLMKVFDQGSPNNCYHDNAFMQMQKKIEYIDPMVMVGMEKRLKPYVTLIPVQFYTELFRLHGLNFDKDSVARPIHFSILVNDLIFERLPLDTLIQLKTKLKKDKSSKKYQQQHHALHIANAQLNQHIGKIMAMMQLSDNELELGEKMNRLLPVNLEAATFVFEAKTDDLPTTGL